MKTKCASCGVNNVPKVWKKVKRKTGKTQKTVCNGRAQLCRLCSLRSPTPRAYGQGKKGQHQKPYILAPSVKNRAESILNDIHKLSQTLPISKMVAEIASFDTQKMANALVNSMGHASARLQDVEYQHGTLFGYEVKQYLLTVNKHKCAYCGGLSGDSILEIEHIHPQSKGGTSKISNLTISCRVCNEAKGSMTLEQWERALKNNPSEINDKRFKSLPALKKQSKLKKGFKYSALTQSYKNYLLSELRNDFAVEVTFGTKTKYYRNQLELPKSQLNDALVIASEGKPVKMPQYYLLEKQVKKRYPYDYISPPKKGQPIVKYKRQPEMFTSFTDAFGLRFGFKLWDKVKCNHAKNNARLRLSAKLGEVVGYVQGRRSSGSFAIASLLGDLLIGGISYKKLVLLQPALSNYIRERRNGNISFHRNSLLAMKTNSDPPDSPNQKGSPP